MSMSIGFVSSGGTSPYSTEFSVGLEPGPVPLHAGHPKRASEGKEGLVAGARAPVVTASPGTHQQ